MYVQLAIFQQSPGIFKQKFLLGCLDKSQLL